jgi:ComF family protein
LLQTILDIVYPARCPVCGEIVIPKGEKACMQCRKKLTYITEPRCKKCSKPIEQEEKEYCSDCEQMNFHFVKGYAVWLYDSVMKRSIADFKYHGRKEYAKFYVQEMVQIYGETLKRLRLDAIVPVPVHASKYLERGYNQADILARMLGKELAIPVLSRLLIRNKKTLPQKQLSDKERLRNLIQAFSLDKSVSAAYHKTLNRVLLVDDIFTTGSTIEACTNVFMAHGIDHIYFITLCIGKGY